MDFLKLPTLEEIIANESGIYNDVIDQLQKFRYSYPVTPIKPRLAIKHTADEATRYSIDLKDYEREMEIYNAEKKEIIAHNNKVDKLIEDWVKEDTGLNDIPAQYRDKVYSLAYSHGHSGGHREIRNYLIDLVNIFN